MTDIETGAGAAVRKGRTGPLPIRGFVVRRLLRHYRAADPALARPDWYDRQRAAMAALATDTAIPFDVLIRAIAVLSPATTWEPLLACMGPWALSVLGRGPKPIPGPGSYGSNVRKARRIILDLVTGPKVSRFARNLLGDRQAVTLDRWACRAAGVTENEPSTERRYARLELEHQIAATVAPSTFQAVIWEHLRKSA